MARILDPLSTLAILAGMLAGLPLLGAWLAGQPPACCLQFPPDPGSVAHAPFSWPAFAFLSTLTAAVLAWLGRRAAESWRRSLPAAAVRRHPFPRWGILAAAMGAGAWALAWTRFDWFAPFQEHTFTPLWLAYIVVVNAACVARTGGSPLTDRPGLLIGLFPASALFWWFFEYLNRFVANWTYSGTHLDAWSYFWSATLPFSTVLPAVLSTQTLVRSFPALQRAFGRVRPLPQAGSRLWAWFALLAAATGLVGIGVRPDWFYPLVWVAPLALLIAIRALRRQPHPLQDLATPDWTAPASAALAALVCGVFWEMWNYWSLARWTYSIPYAHRFEIFEMPLLGYAGYLPFGLECAAVMALVEDFIGDRRRAESARRNACAAHGRALDLD
ncbi:MAG TPA: hypothetical protein VLH81_06255 [Desulfobacterales bacterium]|nr:hypothetical protein [Desulfobacterales bacterium]